MSRGEGRMPTGVQAYVTLRNAPLPGDWAARAACRGMNTGQFFPSRGELGRNPTWLTDVCAACPVREPCRAYALRWPVLGWWAGMSEVERVRWRRQRRRAS